ncbi:MAG TPA: hypothetical protein VMR18_04705 [Candidatus Saccharimonadales bacterium]|nr:hypothetical protein [Candidatus Saccharimonadales bacterium]
MIARRHPHRKKLVWLIFIVGLLAFSVVIISSSKPTRAASIGGLYRLPFDIGDRQHPIYEEIAEPNAALSLNAPIGSYDLYASPANGAKNIDFEFQLDSCPPDNTGIIAVEGCAKPGQPTTIAQFSVADTVHVYYSGPITQSGTLPSSSTYYSYVIPTADATPIPGSNLYSVKLQVFFPESVTKAGLGALYAFRINTIGTNTQVFYSQSDQDQGQCGPGQAPPCTPIGDSFSEQQRGGVQGSDSQTEKAAESTLEIPFSVACAVSPGYLEQLQWYDADGYPGGIPWNPDINFDLLDRTSNSPRTSYTQFYYPSGAPFATYTQNNQPLPAGVVGSSDPPEVSSASQPEIGGDEAYGTASFKANPGDDYLWTWNNVEFDNGVQFSIPTDAVLPDLGCSKDHQPTLTATCTDNMITGIANDQDALGQGGGPVTVEVKTTARGLGGNVDIVGIAASSKDGYWEADSDGQVYEFGNAPDFPDPGGVGPTIGGISPVLSGPKVVGIASTPDGGGYWLVDDAGTVYPFGDATNYGSSPSGARTGITGIAVTPDGGGYWLVTRYGAVIPFGDAGEYENGVTNYGGGKGEPNIVGIAADQNIGKSTSGPNGTTVPSAYYGYWLIGSNGTVWGKGGPNATVSQAPWEGEKLTSGSDTDVAIVADPTSGSNQPNQYYYEVSSEGNIWVRPAADPSYGSPISDDETVSAPITSMAVTPDGTGYWETGNNGQIYNFGSAKDHGWAISQSIGKTTTTAPYTSNPNFTFDPSNWLATGPTSYVVIAEDVPPPNYTGTPANNATEIVTCGAPSNSVGTVHCNLDNTNPDQSAYDPFTATMKIKFTGQGPISGSAVFTVTGTSLVYSKSYPGITAGSTFSPFNITQNITIDPAGTYTLSGVYTYNGGSASCSTSVTVYNQPYLSVSGGDVSVGGYFGTTCTDNNGPPKPGVYSWNNDSGGYSGAGDQFAVYALGPIRGFASSAINDPPTDLSFSNTTDISQLDSNGLNNATDGGGFGEVPCPTNYFASPEVSATLPPNSPVNMSSLIVPNKNKVYNYAKPGGLNLTLNADASIPDSSQVTLYVTGNVYIRGNLTYNSNGGNGHWTTVSEIPAFRLYVSGNIYIDSGVTNLEGVYVAQPTSLKAAPQVTGFIYDCATNAFAPVTTAALGNCDQSLNINGSFTAYHIDFERVSGTLDHGSAAESFTYDPAVWLTTPALASPGQYSAVENLPPIL